MVNVCLLLFVLQRMGERPRVVQNGSQVADVDPAAAVGAAQEVLRLGRVHAVDALADDLAARRRGLRSGIGDPLHEDALRIDLVLGRGLGDGLVHGGRLDVA